jgi:hypothetical protein
MICVWARSAGLASCDSSKYVASVWILRGRVSLKGVNGSQITVRIRLTLCEELVAEGALWLRREMRLIRAREAP